LQAASRRYFSAALAAVARSQKITAVKGQAGEQHRWVVNIQKRTYAQLLHMLVLEHHHRMGPIGDPDSHVCTFTHIVQTINAHTHIYIHTYTHIYIY